MSMGLTRCIGDCFQFHLVFTINGQRNYLLEAGFSKDPFFGYWHFQALDRIQPSNYQTNRDEELNKINTVFNKHHDYHVKNFGFVQAFEAMLKELGGRRISGDPIDLVSEINFVRALNRK